MSSDVYTIRPFAEADIDFVADVLAQAEGYEETDALLTDVEALRDRMRGFLDDTQIIGYVTVTPSQIVGFLFGQLRNRWTDSFDNYSIVPELPDRLFTSSGAFFEMVDLWVSAAHRRKGIATRLKLYLEEDLQNRDCKTIYTHTELNNDHVIELNTKLGYVPVRTGPIWDDILRVSLMKTLA